MKKINIAILGLGIVGGGTYEILRDNGEMIKQEHGVDVRVARVLERRTEPVLRFGVPLEAVASNISDITDDPEISIVVETIGGVEPARSFILAALGKGKTVVTANKELVAKHGGELERAAKASKAGFYYEASCVGGVPVIRTLIDSMQANKITRIMGIVNGTTNYILTKMTEENLPYAAALKEAQNLGYAEANPDADVEGYDAVYKLSILSRLAFREDVPYSEIYREGISKLDPEDIAAGLSMGYRTKLLAIGERDGTDIRAGVSPCFLPAGHPLAAVSGVFNGVHISGDFVGDIMLYGRGAGARPTGSAIVSDIICAALASGHRYHLSGRGSGAQIIADYRAQYYLRLTADDRAGVMAKVTATLAGHDISISRMMQRESKGGVATIIFLTHAADSKAMRIAVAKLAEYDCISCINSVIRIVE